MKRMVWRMSMWCPVSAARCLSLVALPPQVRNRPQGVVRGSDHVAVHLESTLGPDELDQFLRWIHVRSLEKPRKDPPEVLRERLAGDRRARRARLREQVFADLLESHTEEPLDRVILDMLAPWECVAILAESLVPGGVFCAYVATTTQLAETVETLRVHGGFTEPEATETLVRAWHVEGLAVRPRHDMVGHTGFVITARRLAPGFTAPLRKRRPARGAYGNDYKGPRSQPG